MSEKLKIALPIVVEGRYDKNTLLQIFDATVIATDGFGVFNSETKRQLIRRLGCNGLIVLTDSDGAGKQIRSFLSGIIPRDKIFNVYIPSIEGKERRKRAPSKQGLLGVEGMTREVLVKVLAPFITDGGRAEFSAKKSGRMITKVDFYQDGLTGCEGAVERRRALALEFDLPPDITANALLEAINLLSDYDGYKAALNRIKALD